MASSRATRSSLSGENTLVVFTFNVWGLKFISKDRSIRIRAIAEYLSRCRYDIVCLQECWVYQDFEIIRQAVRGYLPYARFFHTGALGSGLAIFTRFPVIHARALPYSLSGTPQQTIAGDFFVNKAAANIVILHPVLGEVEIWNTHMHAGGEHAPDTRQSHRIAQSWQLANQIRNGAAKGRYVLVMGDFNSQPFSIPISMMRSQGELNDSWIDSHPATNDSIPSGSSPQDALETLGMSCDSPLNTWSHGKPIPQHILAQGGKRLDYIFYRQPAPRRRRRPTIGEESTSSSHHGLIDTDGATYPSSNPEQDPLLKCVTCQVSMTDLVPNHPYSYSDHFGLLATFSIDSTSSRQQPGRSPTSKSDKSGGSIGSSRSEVISSALTVIQAYNVIARDNSRFHLRMSGLAVVLLVGLTVGSAWQPKSWIQPIFTIIAGVLGAAGATFFYFGFLWGRWEEGLLREVIEEMDLELKVLDSREPSLV